MRQKQQISETPLKYLNDCCHDKKRKKPGTVL